jgi:TolA-binding protein
MNQPAKALEHFNKIASEFPDSSLAAEASFHVGSAAYQNEKWKDAITAFEKSVAANADAPGSESIREKALYKLAWAHYKQNQFADSEKQFGKQIELFPGGELFADGQFMVAESQFRQDKWTEALKNYLLAKPAIDATANISSDVRIVAHLHGAQAANKAGSFQDAIDFAMPLTTGDADESVKHDAWLEIGTAYLGLKNFDEAKAALERAAVANNKTGARAGCLIGDLLFGQKKFEEAITQYKLVYYRFSGPQTPDDIKPWLAYALYESGQCSYVQISTAPDSEKANLKSQAQKQFETLVKNFPADKLAPQAKKQLEQIQKM